MKKLLFLLMIFGSTFLLTSGSALAVSGPLYQVVGQNAYSIHKYGTYGEYYVISGRILADTHVTSLYVFQDPSKGNNMMETGYVESWSPDAPSPADGKPYWFAAWVDDGVYKVNVRSQASERLSTGWHSSTVRNITESGTYSNKWVANLWDPPGGGTWTYNHTFKVRWSGGESLASSERWDHIDSNYAHFQKLQSRTSTGEWSWWTAIVQDSDNDPDWSIQYPTPSNSRFYVNRG